MGRGATYPAEPEENAPDRGEDPRTEPVDEPPVERDKPGLQQHKQGKDPLDAAQLPQPLIDHVRGEQGPGVLKIGIRNLGDDGRHKNPPSILHEPLLRACTRNSRTHVGSPPPTWRLPQRSPLY